jgi:cytochrome b pre-mRNA-processing protein 3
VANLHTWLLTARLRALPAPAGQQHIQALVDHFFYDVEDRIRRVLRAAPTQGAAFPLPMPTSSPSSPTRTPTARAAALQPYYVPPARPARGYAPERLVAQQMRVLREQWAGLALALDVALARGDAELAAAAWRNLMGARGAQGIAYPWAGMTPEQDAAHFHRAINFAGMKAREAKKVDDAPERVAAQERQDDFSGVHDYRPSEVRSFVAWRGRLLMRERRPTSTSRTRRRCTRSCPTSGASSHASSAFPTPT